MRILDRNDGWTDTLIELSKLGRRLGKQVCLHTHIDHPNEITWITKAAAHHLFEKGVIVRNQTVLLKGVNDDVKTMGTLIRSLADMNIQPVSPIDTASSFVPAVHSVSCVYACAPTISVNQE